MRLVCSVSSVCRDPITQASRCISLVGRKIRSTVSIFKKGEDSFLLWCSAKNKSGAKYKLRDNVEKCFNKKVEEGKATLRLIDPKIDIQISEADNVNLKRLINAVKLASKGQSLVGQGVLSSSGPVQSKVIKKPQTKMHVQSKQSYPVLKGFPSSLEVLTADNCDLVKVDSRILKLRHLAHLDLSNNGISVLPDGISAMQCLHTLKLEGNHLGELPKTFCEPSSKLCNTLRSLNLSKNKMKYLPENIGNLQELYQIQLCENHLQFLPHEIGKLKKLKILSASRNQIRVIPFSVRQLVLDSIDVTRNDFMDVGSSSVANRLQKYRALEDLAASFIIRKGIQYDSESLTYPCRELLKRGRKCLFCSTYVFGSYVRLALSLDLSRISQKVMYFAGRWRKNAPVDIFICSEKCFRRLRFNYCIRLDLADENRNR